MYRPSDESMMAIGSCSIQTDIFFMMTTNQK